MLQSNILLLGTESIDDIVLLVGEAYQDLPYPLAFEPRRVQEFLNACPNLLMLGLVRSDGELLGVLLGLKTLLSTSFSPVATELLWYVKPEYRRGKYALQMVREFEKWAEAEGCHMISMGNMANDSMDRTGKFYERLGYKLSEQTFYKDLK